KRGAHLAISLERLDAITHARPNRIGLSATQRPLSLVAEFLSGNTPGAPFNPSFGLGGAVAFVPDLALALDPDPDFDLKCHPERSEGPLQVSSLNDRSKLPNHSSIL